MPPFRPEHPALTALRNAKEEHESYRIEREAYLIAWELRFDVEALHRMFAHTAATLFPRDLTWGQERDLAVSIRAVAIADSITDEELIAAGFPARGRKVA